MIVTLDSCFFPREIKNRLPARPVLVEAAAYIVCYLLIHAGYFININKSHFIPSTTVHCLGLIGDSLPQVFLEIRDKNDLRRWGKQYYPLVPLIERLHRFSGKAISFSLVIPGYKLYTQETVQGHFHSLPAPLNPQLKLEGTFETKSCTVKISG